MTTRRTRRKTRARVTRHDVIYPCILGKHKTALASSVLWYEALYLCSSHHPPSVPLRRPHPCPIPYAPHSQ